MSEVRDAENITTLEELFRSREFGKPVARVAPVKDDTLFGGTPPRAPLVPLAAAPSAGHFGTTHVRLQSQDRNRLFATVSGVAAAVLIAVGFVTGIGKPGTKSPGVSATGTTLPPTTTTPTTTPIGPPPITPVIKTGGTAGLASARGGSLVSTKATVVDVVVHKNPRSAIRPAGIIRHLRPHRYQLARHRPEPRDPC